jgi:cell division septum initiation protein DivIVA
MKWFEYKQEVDALHASEALKARLCALQPDGESAVPRAFEQADVCPPAAQPARKAKKIKFPVIPWRRAAALAACFALGILACDTFGIRLLPRMGSSSDLSMNMMPSYSEKGDAYTAGQSYDGGENYSSGTVEAPGAAEDTSAAEDWASGGGVNMPSQYSSSRKIIYNASLTLESKDYDATLSALNDAVKAAGGYIESSDESAYTGDTRYCSITCRIPADAYTDFLTAAAGTGSLTNKSQSAQDVTSEYVDIAARIQALETQRDRLLELEKQAGDLSDLLQIEDSLSNVQYELENYQSQQKIFDDQIEYSTVCIDVREVSTYTPVQTGFWQRLREAFSLALTQFGSMMAEIVFWLAGLWPWLVLIAAVAGIVVVVKKVRRKK